MAKIEKIDRGNNSILKFTTDNNKTAELQFTDKGFIVKGAAVGSYEVKELPYASNLIIDASKANMFYIEVTGNIDSINFYNLQPGSYVLIVKQDAVGSHDINWTSTITQYMFEDGIKPTASTSAGAVDIYGLFYDGTYVYVFPNQNYSLAV